MISRLSRSELLLHLLFFCVVGWDVVLYLRGETTSFANYYFNIAYGMLWFVGGVAGMVFARWYGGWTSRIGRALILFSLALFMDVIGQCLWTYYNIVQDVAVPTPSLADIAWYLSYPLMGWGAYLLIRSRPAVIDPWKAGVSLIAPLLALFMIGSLFAPLLFTGEPWSASTGVNAAYLLFDAITIALGLIAISVFGGTLGSALLIFLVGTIVRSVGNLLFFWRVEEGTYWNGDVSDALFAAAAYLQALALIRFAPGGKHAASTSTPA